MPTWIYVLGGIAVVVISCAVIEILRKKVIGTVTIPSLKNWKWLIKLAVVVGILYWGVPWVKMQYQGYKAIQLASRTPAVPVITSAEQWVYEDFLPANVYIRGKNRSGEIQAEIIKRDDQDLWIDLAYVEYGRQEKTRFRLSKVANGAWEGTWEQNRPKDFGRCNLREVGGSDTLAGTITGTDGITAVCTLKKK
jgi:hypothetical protein